MLKVSYTNLHFSSVSKEVILLSVKDILVGPGDGAPEIECRTEFGWVVVFLELKLVGIEILGKLSGRVTSSRRPEWVLQMCGLYEFKSEVGRHERKLDPVSTKEDLYL